MSSILIFLNNFMPVLGTFGPLFLIIKVKGEEDSRGPKTKKVNFVGLFMVVMALMLQSLSIANLSSRVQSLEQQVEHFQSHIHPLK
jgi:hypothetical protein